MTSGEQRTATGLPCLTWNADVLTASTAVLAATARAHAAGSLEIHRFEAGNELQTWLTAFLRDHARHELLSVSPGSFADLAVFERVHRVNMEFFANGVRMLSIFDYTRTALEGPPEMLSFMAASREVTYLVGCGPVQLKVADRSRVVLEAPRREGERRGLAISTSRDVVASALRYLRTVRETAVPVTALAPPPNALSGRQLLVGSLLAQGHDDAAIAEALALSIRTVRYEIAKICQELGAPTRFAAGAAFARAIASRSR